MALDDLMTRSIAVNSAATFIPVGSVQVGDAANFDEIDFYTGNKGTINRQMAAVAYVPQATGTTPSMTITFETADDVAFGTNLTTRATARAITAAGKYYLFQVGGYPQRYGRFKCVATGTTPNFGTVVCALVDAENNIFFR